MLLSARRITFSGMVQIARKEIAARIWAAIAVPLLVLVSGGTALSADEAMRPWLNAP